MVWISLWQPLSFPLNRKFLREQPGKNPPCLLEHAVLELLLELVIHYSTVSTGLSPIKGVLGARRKQSHWALSETSSIRLLSAWNPAFLCCLHLLFSFSGVFLINQASVPAFQSHKEALLCQPGVSIALVCCHFLLLREINRSPPACWEESCWKTPPSQGLSQNDPSWHHSPGLARHQWGNWSLKTSTG